MPATCFGQSTGELRAERRSGQARTRYASARKDDLRIDLIPLFGDRAGGIGPPLDANPVVGVPAATIPALLLAFTVSIQVAIAVLVLYSVPPMIENYVIVPGAYGGQLQIGSIRRPRLE